MEREPSYEGLKFAGTTVVASRFPEVAYSRARASGPPRSSSSSPGTSSKLTSGDLLDSLGGPRTSVLRAFRGPLAPVPVPARECWYSNFLRLSPGMPQGPGGPWGSRVEKVRESWADLEFSTFLIARLCASELSNFQTLTLSDSHAFELSSFHTYTLSNFPTFKLSQ